jgi:AcrR family transcriptional regulator
MAESTSPATETTTGPETATVPQTQTVGPVPPGRPKRADARRNYDRLIAAAESAFAEHGPEASLDGIAKAAGVGPGTLYRHFPTRRALLEAVYQERIAELCGLGADLADEPDPVEALSRWLHRVASHTLLYRGLKDVLMADPADDGSPTDFSWCAARMRGTAGALLNQARAAGTVADDLQAVDLLRLVHGVVLSTAYLPEPERTAATDRLLDLMLNGLRRG